MLSTLGRAESVTGDPTVDPASALALVDALRGSDRRAETTNCVAVDEEGNACALTTTLGLGSGVWVPGYGVHLNSMLGEGELVRGELVPGVRMGSMMSPMVVFDDDEPVIVAGAAGGSRIRPALVQCVLRHAAPGSAPQEAIGSSAAGRAARDLVRLEPGFSAEVIEALELAGNTVAVAAQRRPYFGGVSAIEHTRRWGRPAAQRHCHHDLTDECCTWESVGSRPGTVSARACTPLPVLHLSPPDPPRLHPGRGRGPGRLPARAGRRSDLPVARSCRRRPARSRVRHHRSERIDPDRGGEEGCDACSPRRPAPASASSSTSSPTTSGIAVPAENPAWWDVLRLGRESRVRVVVRHRLDPGAHRGADPGDDDPTLTHRRRRAALLRAPLPAGRRHLDRWRRPAAVHDRQHYELVHYPAATPS